LWRVESFCCRGVGIIRVAGKILGILKPCRCGVRRLLDIRKGCVDEGRM